MKQAAALAMIRLMRKQLLSAAEALSTLRDSSRAPQGRGQTGLPLAAPRPVKAVAA